MNSVLPALLARTDVQLDEAVDGELQEVLNDRKDQGQEPFLDLSAAKRQLSEQVLPCLLLNGVRPAKLMQETCDEELGELGLGNTTRCSSWPRPLEKIALEDGYFISRKRYLNVDFYSGIVQRTIGVPVNTCSPASSHWRAPSAGSPSSTKCWPTPNTRSAARASSTPARRARKSADEAAPAALGACSRP